MTQNFIIYLIIILVCIIIFLIYFYKNFNKKSKNIKNIESFFPWDFDKNTENKPNFVKNYEDINFDKKPNYRYENITQYNFNRLFEELKKINKEKVTLRDKGNYNFYTQSTTQDKLRMDLDIISKYVILLLNNDKYYDFNKTNFGDVEVWIDKNGNEEIKYELFLWDKKNYFEIKLWIYIIKFIEEKEIGEYGIKDQHYIFPDFNIGLPFKDQMIPLPIDVIITGHFDTSIDSIKPNIPSKIKYLYLNQIEVQNSTLIVDYHKDKYPFNKLKVTDDGFSGVNDMSLEYSVMKGKTDHNPYLQSGREYNKWITLDEELKWKSQYPAKFPPIKKWDDLGIYYYQKDIKKNMDINTELNIDSYPDTEEIIFTKEDTENEKRYCDVYEPGTRWSEQKEPLQPYFWPSNYTVMSNCGENYWLFDESKTVGGNTFIGGGKR